MSSNALAVCITHTSAFGHPTHLAPFAVWPAFPTSDYYGASVALGVAPVRRSRVPTGLDVQDGVGASFVSLFRSLEATQPSQSASNGVTCSRRGWERQPGFSHLSRPGGLRFGH